jgi:hypothetical protein
LINTNPVAQTVDLQFFGNNGDPLALPLQLGQGISNLSHIVLSLPQKSRLTITSVSGPSDPVLEGWVLSFSGTGVTGVVRFRYGPSGQESVVPLETRRAPSYLVPFDYTGASVAGLAIANIAVQAVTIPVIIRDDAGNEITRGVIDLPAHGHTSFMLSDRFPSVTGKSGAVELLASNPGQISILRLRAIPGGAIVTVPVLASAP